MQFSESIPLLHRAVLQQMFYILWLDSPDEGDWKVEYNGKQYVMVQTDTGKLIKEAENG